jgi:hypothetical protein
MKPEAMFFMLLFAMPDDFCLMPHGTYKRI